MITDCQNIVAMNQGRVHRKGTFGQLNRVDDLNKEQSSKENFSDINDEKYNDSIESNKSIDSDEESIVNISNVSFNLQGFKSLSNENKKSIDDQLHKTNTKISFDKKN